MIARVLEHRCLRGSETIARALEHRCLRGSETIARALEHRCLQLRLRITAAVRIGFFLDKCHRVVFITKPVLE
jgi:hypothetical protein